MSCAAVITVIALLAIIAAAITWAFW